MMPTIVVAAYDRPKSLERLLFSLTKAYYETIPKLIISIDGGGSSEVIEIANKLEWSGDKSIILHKENLGLKEHILKCGDLTETYDEIILLEEDLFVAKDFFNFSKKSLSFYKNNPKISGISLYQYEYVEVDDLPFTSLVDRYDTYFIKMASSWGQAWDKIQWAAFKNWYAKNSAWDDKDIRLPEDVAKWPETSWKKYFIKYLIDEDKYFVYPRISLTTNFGDEGENNGYKNSLHQVNLLVGLKPDWDFASFEDGIKYDTHFNLTYLRELEPENLYSLQNSYDMRPFDLNFTEGLLPISKYQEMIKETQKDKSFYRNVFNISDSRAQKIQNELPPIRIQILNAIGYYFKKLIR